MTTFSGYHIQQFNQRIKSLVGDGKLVMTYKELRDLQGEILDLFVSLRQLETQLAEATSLASQNAEIKVELVGDTFKK